MSYEFLSLLEAVSFSPTSLTRPLAWVGHMPFAFWLMQNARPRLFVELGTHAGNSYFAFCQAVRHAGLSTQCHAVDSWQGDEHAGSYGAEVFDRVVAHNQQNYSDFSHLLRMSFDEAAKGFAPQSIDMLHIDGLHSYEAVRHDFETWLPLLAPDAFVLFHDTSVRGQGFGVWKLWQELQQHYPWNFEFYHSNGLGILQLSSLEQQPRFPWLQPNFEYRHHLQVFFATLGTSLNNRYMLDELTQRFNERGLYADELNVALEKSSKSIDDLKFALEGSVNRTSELKAELQCRDNEINEVRKELVKKEAEIQTLKEIVKDIKVQIETANYQAHQALISRDDALRHYNEITDSTFWKLSYPLRRVTANFPSLRRHGRRALHFFWWALTGQLVGRLRQRRVEPQCPPAAAQLQPQPAEVARPLEEDTSLAVPFENLTGCEEPDGKIAVICHLFHEDLASEIRRYLTHIPFSFDLYISTDDSFKRQVIEGAFRGFIAGSVEIRLLPNRGRDIAPKLVGFADIYSKYSYVLHLHSKCSHHASVLEFWRGYLLETLLGSPEIIRSIFAAFNQQPDLGLIAPQHFEPVRHWINWGGNFPVAQQLAKRLGLQLDENKILDFPSGSMFWARTAALKPIIDAHLEFSDFPEEAGQIDGTLAHSIERLFFYICEVAGYHWLKIARPKLLPHTPAIEHLAQVDYLSAYFEQHGFRLCDGNGRLPRPSPPSAIAEPSQELIHSLQASALGSELQLPSVSVVIGIVTYNNPESALSRLIQSALHSLQQAGLAQTGKILLVDNGKDTSACCPYHDSVKYLPTQGNVGFGAAHNLLMAQSFGQGAEIYIAANPDGLFHPGTVQALVQMMMAHQSRALVEALQFPDEHPKPYDPCTFDTPWVSGACLAIPRSAYEELGGFDPLFFMYCEDVDLSWRARAQGFALRTCPRALFLHEVTNRPNRPEIVKMIYTSGILLARRWCAPDFEQWLCGELRNIGHEPPSLQPEPVPLSMRRYADFSHHFSFSKPRW